MYEVYHVEERQVRRKGAKSPKLSAARCVFFRVFQSCFLNSAELSETGL